MILILVFCLFGISNGDVLSAKALYCQDPDTGLLHAVNTTWSATSFCGNYTCKSRALNNNDTSQAAVRTIINVTSVMLEPNNDTTYELNVVTEEKNSPNTVKVFHKDNSKVGIHNFKTNQDPNNDRFGHVPFRTGIGKSGNISHTSDKLDRYLNEAEIKAIAAMLQSLKKSDVENIIEIYKLAQTIYEEINEKKSPKVPHNEILDKHSKELLEDIKIMPKTHVSYWYDPIFSNSVQKYKDDMQSEGSTLVPSKAAAPNIILPKTTSIANTNLGRIPYYNFITRFVKTSTQKPSTTTVPRSQPVYCKYYSAQNRALLMPWYKSVRRTDPDDHFVQTSFHSHPFSYSAYPGSSYYKNRWPPQAYYNLQIKPSTQASVSPFGPIPNFVVDATKSPKNLVQSSDTNKLAENTELPINSQIIESKLNSENDCKLSNSATKTKIKFDKISRLINLDELFRTKRQVIDETPIDDVNEDFLQEVYLEKTTCQTDMNVGIYAMGNLTESFPRCCPHILEKHINKTKT